MTHYIDINCDMGESFGKFTKGRDPEVMPYITTANIAGGYHAGDPHVMRRTVALADDHGVAVGVHPGLPDKLGFGRRTIDAPPEEVRDYVVYQLGVPFQHVKLHGAMYTMLSESDAHARAVIEGILDVDEDLIYLATDMNIYEVAQEYPIRTAFEGYVDLDYRSDRSVVIPKEKTARDPELVADRFVTIATEGVVETPSGEQLDIPAESICIHGDTPNVVEILEEIHERLNDVDIELTSVRDIV